MKIKGFRGDLTDISAKKEVLPSITFVLDTPVRSPRKVCIVMITTYVYRITVSRILEPDLKKQSFIPNYVLLQCSVPCCCYVFNV